MDKKQVLEQLIKGLKDIKEDLQKKEDDLVKAGEATAKVNTPAAMGALKAKAAANNAAARPEPALPPSNEVTKKVAKPPMAKEQKDEKTTEESAGKTVEKIAQGSKTVHDASKNLQDKDNYPQHTKEKAKKKGLTPFMLAKKGKEKK